MMTGKAAFVASLFALQGGFMATTMPGLSLDTASGVITFVAVEASFGAAFFFILRWMMRLYDTRLVELTQEVKDSGSHVRAAIRDATKAEIQAIRENSKQTAISSMIALGLQEQFTLHDATVTGINPSTGNTQDDRDRSAVMKLEHTLASLRRVQVEVAQAANLSPELIEAYLSKTEG